MPQTRAQAASAASGDLLSQAQSSSEHTVLKGWDHWLIIGPTTVTTRELRRSEHLLQDGKSIAPCWFAERLRNELAVTDFLRANTTLPIPKSRLYTDGGLLHLERERIPNGICLHDFIYKVGRPAREAAIKAVGSVDESIPVFPPYRVFGKDRRDWPRITSEKQEFVLCHTSLDEQNIYVDAVTYKILGIVGWECAGYFPPYFELPVWLDSLDDSPNLYPEAKKRELAFFGLTAEDLVDDGARKQAQ